MFNLDQAIAQWRRQMLAAGIKTPVPLEELESHLRDEIEQQMRSGLSAQHAFEAAARRIGEAPALRLEFAKARTRSQALMMRFASGLLVGLILLLSGFTFFQMQLTPAEQILAYTGVIFTLVVACGWRYAVPFLPVIANKRKRTAIGSACILFGFLFTSFFTNIILPRFEHGHDHQLPALGFWAVLPIAVFVGLGCGLDQAGRGQRKPIREEPASG